MWLLIDQATGGIIAGPTDAEPSGYDADAAIAVQTVLGYPDTATWSPALRGFVDRLVPTLRLSRIAYQRLFTQAERIAIRASADPIVVDFRELAAIAETIDLDDADVVNGTRYLEAVGLIGAGRAALILGGGA